MWKPGWERIGGRMDTCIHMAESLHCSPETTKTLFIGYTPIQNKKFNNNKNSCEKKRSENQRRKGKI